MTNSSNSKGFLSRRLGLPAMVVVPIVAVAVLGVALFVAWLTLGGGVWRGEVRVMDAELRSPDRLMLFVDSCHGDPELSLLQEGDAEVQVKVVSSSRPFGPGGACQDGVEVQLQRPLGNRVVIDKHTGQSVRVRTINQN